MKKSGDREVAIKGTNMGRKYLLYYVRYNI